jgi:hypothetical protein
MRVTMQSVDETHRLQAASFLRRWSSRRRAAGELVGDSGLPDRVDMPRDVWTHYRHFSWVIHEQRLVLLALGVFLAGCIGVWALAFNLDRKPPVVVRAGPSLKEAAAAFYGVPEVSYDALAFFLHGCLPLLYSIDDSGHPLLPLAQGLVAPDVYSEAERRLNASAPEVQANRMTQELAITGVADVVADARSGRAAAYVRGYVTVTVRHAEAQFFPWRAQVLLAMNPVSRLNPYPFYILRCEERMGPGAPSWDSAHDNRRFLLP